MNSPPIPLYSRFLKRGFDIVAAGTLLAVAAPPMVALAGVIASRMGRPVLFTQTRPGRNGKLFSVYKFRTMTDARGPDGKLRPDAERLTRLGAFLRKTSLDELPELVNVLKGEMSLVGPRPLLVRYLPYFTERERARHDVRPGITGWAQIHGRNEVGWQARLAYDVWYVENHSFLLDLKILVSTLLLVARREGVIVNPGSAMKDLDEERAGMST